MVDDPRSLADSNKRHPVNYDMDFKQQHAMLEQIDNLANQDVEMQVRLLIQYLHCRFIRYLRHQAGPLLSS
jgi:hypothetical protein